MTAPPHRDEGRQSLARRGPSRDELALAERLLAAARRGADVRARKVRRLRAAIRVKAYENDLKLVVALENLLAAIGPASPEPRNPKPAPLGRRSRTIRDEFGIPKKK